MSSVLLSAALIVKNEERCLERCLQSLQDLVDEVVVVDTGSTDRTREIASDCGARLYDFAWVDDFAAARNHALDLARGEWIFYIDADERVRPCSPCEFRAQLMDPSGVAHYVLLHPRPQFTPYWELRVFRNDARIRFRGIMHENIWPGIDAYRAAHGGTIGYSSLVFDHDGYEGDQHQKHLRNLPLLRKALQEDPSRVFSWCHLANVYVALDQEELAEQAWQTALNLVRQKQWLQAEDSLPFIGLIQWQGARGDDVEPLLMEALQRFPQHLQLLWLRGKTLMSAGQFEAAISLFERLVACGQTGDFDRSMAYDVRLFDLFPYDALAACHFKLGHYAESRHYFELVATFAPENLEYRVKRALCSQLESRQRRSLPDVV